MAEELDPKTFDLDAWLQDAHLPEVSARIFKGGHLLAELESVREQIEDEQAAMGQSLTSAQKLSELTERYEQLLEQFGESALTVYCQAIPGSKLRDLRKEFDERSKAKKWNTAESSAEFGYMLVANSVVAVKPAEGTKTEVTWNAESVKNLEKQIGPGELGKLLKAHKRAQSELKEPDADFLRKSSGTSSNGTED